MKIIFLHNILWSCFLILHLFPDFPHFPTYPTPAFFVSPCRKKIGNFKKEESHQANRKEKQRKRTIKNTQIYTLHTNTKSEATIYKQKTSMVLKKSLKHYETKKNIEYYWFIFCWSSADEHGAWCVLISEICIQVRLH